MQAIATVKLIRRNQIRMKFMPEQLFENILQVQKSLFKLQRKLNK